MGSVGQGLDFNDTTPAAPAGATNVKWQADAPGAPTDPPRNLSAYVVFAYDTTIYFGGRQTSANQEIFRQNIRHTQTYAGNFSGSGGSVDSSTAATGSTTFTVKKNGSAVGTIVWAGAGTTPTFTTTGGAAFTVNQDDILTIDGPATPDATLSNWAVTLVSMRTS